jgi:hypothetical protein
MGLPVNWGVFIVTPHRIFVTEVNIVVSYRAPIGPSPSRSARLCQIVVFRRVQVHPGHGVDPAQMVVNFLHPGNVLGTDDDGLP